MTKMKNCFRAVLCVAVLSVLWCSNSPALAGKPAVPIKGNAKGVVVGAVPDSETPWIVNLTVEWEGVSSHLGKFTRTDWLVVNFATGELFGTKTFTAANGDQLDVYTEGEFDPTAVPSLENPLEITGTYEFTGGTGRFEDATGNANFRVLTPDFAVGLLDFEGSIDY
jgi:hypothetical protein